MMTKIGRTANTRVGGVTRRNQDGTPPNEELVPSFGARRRWQALMAIGHTDESLAPLFGPLISRWTFRSDGPDSLPRATHDLMVAIYEELRDTPGPAVDAAAARARAYGWYNPTEWDTAYIDNPYSRPSSVTLATDLSAGACRGQGEPDLWTDEGQRATLRAKGICRTQCPVRRDCLELALVTPEREGTWGGLSADERKKELPLLEAATVRKGRPLLGSPELEAFLDREVGPRPTPEMVTAPAPRSGHHPVSKRVVKAGAAGRGAR